MCCVSVLLYVSRKHVQMPRVVVNNKHDMLNIRVVNWCERVRMTGDSVEMDVYNWSRFSVIDDRAAGRRSYNLLICFSCPGSSADTHVDADCMQAKVLLMDKNKYTFWTTTKFYTCVFSPRTLRNRRVRRTAVLNISWELGMTWNNCK